MSNIPTNGENDQSLGDGLDRLGDAYGQLQHEEPPELLDQAVLNSAHRAVENKSHWMQFGWLHGLTTAAVFVLALSLIFNQREQVPVYEDGIRVNESIGLQREKTAKKQSGDVQTDDLRMELKEENEKRQDVFQSAPVTTASQDGAIEAVAGDKAAEPAARARHSTYVSEALRAKTGRADQDATANEPASEAEAPADNEYEIEQELLAILKLKQSGDEAWITELARFKQNYPDYPLPDELTK